jgi:hypothetical protein
MNKITLGILLALSFSGYAAPNQTTSALIDSVKAESKSTLNIPQAVTVYRFNTGGITAIKKTIADIEQAGFSTATASLNALEGNQNSTIMVFNSNTEGMKLSPSVLSAALQKNVSIESKSEQEGIMPERLYYQIDNHSLSVINTAMSKFDDGRIVLTQVLDANNNGKEITTQNRVGLPANGAVLNIIRVQPDSYMMVLTTI